MTDISSSLASSIKRGASGSSKPRRRAMRISSDQAASAPSQTTCTRRYTSHTSSLGFTNQRAIATTIRVTVAVISKRWSKTGKERRRQRSTV